MPMRWTCVDIENGGCVGDRYFVRKMNKWGIEKCNFEKCNWLRLVCACTIPNKSTKGTKARGAIDSIKMMEYEKFASQNQFLITANIGYSSFFSTDSGQQSLHWQYSLVYGIFNLLGIFAFQLIECAECVPLTRDWMRIDCMSAARHNRPCARRTHRHAD